MEKSWDAIRRTFITTPMILRSLPVGIVIAAGVFATIWTQSLLRTHEALVVHTHEVINTTKDVLIGLIDAETGQRGYLLTGDHRYLDPYQKALTRLTQLRLDLKNSISDNSEQRSRVDHLGQLMDEKLEKLKQSISIRDQQGSDPKGDIEVSWAQTETMDQIRSIIGNITEAEKSLLSARNAEVENDEVRVKVVAAIVALLYFFTRVGVEVYIAGRPESQNS